MSWLEEKRSESEKFIFPGERLGVIEEFLPGQGTYVENGTIYSATTGYLHLDKINKEAQVHSQVRTPLIPKNGDIVIGHVSSVQDKTMSIDIFQINDKTSNTSFRGVMHVSNTSNCLLEYLNFGVD